MARRRGGAIVAAMTRALVAYASKRGSTAEIARAVADALAARGLDVDCREAGEVRSLDPYDAVVVGSAVYMRRWRGDAKHFLHAHRDALEHRPFWVFSSGPTGDPSRDDPAWTEPSKLMREVEQMGARGHVVFGGSMPAEPHGFVERTMVEGTPPEHRDRRDWDEIRRWAQAIAAELQAGASAG
jgi:menaquinone-dependent protoporphyrinogen oxidase